MPKSFLSCLLLQIFKRLYFPEKNSKIQKKGQNVFLDGNYNIKQEKIIIFLNFECAAPFSSGPKGLKDPSVRGAENSPCQRQHAFRPAKESSSW